MGYLEIIKQMEKGKVSQSEEPSPTTPQNRVKDSHPWLTAWRELAVLTEVIAREDSRFPLVMEALHECDHAYLSGKWTTFWQAATRVRRIVEGRG